MSNEPLRIGYGKLVDLLVGLGIDPDMKTLSSVHIDPEMVTVVRHRTDEDGRKVAAGREVLTETVTIRIDIDRSAPAVAA
jgi:hypothetical protein